MGQQKVCDAAALDINKGDGLNSEATTRKMFLKTSDVSFVCSADVNGCSLISRAYFNFD